MMNAGRLTRLSGVVVATMALAMLPIATSSATSMDSVQTVDRWSGTDRYATAAAISEKTSSAPAPVVFVATGTGFPDALAAGPAAAALGGPLLLVKRDAIPTETATELTRLAPLKIVVLGGAGVVSSQVESSLTDYSPTVERWAGDDRYETAAEVSAHVFSPGVPDVFIATGSNFPDALAGAAAAAHLGAPILLVGASSIPPAVESELARLDPARITVLGGTSAVSTQVQAALGGFTDGTVRRLSGDDRYWTSAAVSEAVFPSSSQAFLATGSNFPDALAGGPVAGAAGGPILLSTSSCLPADTFVELRRLGATTVTLLGGTSALGSGVASLTVCGDQVTYTLPCTVTVSDTRPAAHSTVYVEVTTVPGADLKVRAHIDGTTVEKFATADAEGAARIGFDTGAGAVDDTSPVFVYVSHEGELGACATGFIVG